jgi:hypothetical protein
MTQGADEQRDAGLGEPEGAGGPSGTSASASAIVSAAERLADEIRRSAHADAEQIRVQAGSESDAARAAIDARVRRLSGLADGIHGQLAQMRLELEALRGSLGSSEAAGGAPVAPAAPGTVGPPELAVAQPGGTVGQSELAVAQPEGPAGQSELAVAQSEDTVVSGPMSAPVDAVGLEPSPARARAPVTDPDEVAARLVALNMAMSDTPREEIVRYLREHHSLADPERLLDEVYAGAGR